MVAETARGIVWTGTGGVAAGAFSQGECIIPGALPIAFVAETFGCSVGFLDRLVAVLGRSIDIVGVGSLPWVRRTQVGQFTFRQCVIVDGEM